MKQIKASLYTSLAFLMGIFYQTKEEFFFAVGGVCVVLLIFCYTAEHLTSEVEINEILKNDLLKELGK